MKQTWAAHAILYNGRELGQPQADDGSNPEDNSDEKCLPDRNRGGGQRPKRHRLEHPLIKQANKQAELGDKIMTQDQFGDGSKERHEEDLTAKADLPGSGAPGTNGLTINPLQRRRRGSYRTPVREDADGGAGIHQEILTGMGVSEES